jgi:predicted DNA binding CopG/RHH family protein
MRKNYDFSKSIKNPYIKKLKRQITIRVENDTIDYFKKIAADSDIPYQKLINLFLRDCAQHNKKPEIAWKPHRAA